MRDADVAALASPRHATPRATEDELREHDRITRRIHDVAPSLPSRFGQVFADETALAAGLASRGSELAAALEAVGDRVELAVTLSWRTAPGPAAAATASSGREYLASKAAREHERQQAEKVVARLVEHLPCERAFVRHTNCPRDGVAAIVAILSTRDEMEAMRRDVESFGERSAEVSATVYGPIPPYSFAS